MPNFVSAFLVGRLLEDRFDLQRRDAFTFALVPQLAGLPEVPGLVLSLALGRRNQPPPAPAPATPSGGTATPAPGGGTGGTPGSGGGTGGTPGSGGGTGGTPGSGGGTGGTPGSTDTVTVPDVVGLKYKDAELKLKGADLGIDGGGKTDGIVAQQKPAAGDDAPRGSAVAVDLRDK